MKMNFLNLVSSVFKGAQSLTTNASSQLAQNSADGTSQARADAAASVKTNNEIAAIGMWASTQAALIKMKSDLNDAMNSMIKGVGSSIKSAAQ
jgi:hypothetical protein